MIRVCKPGGKLFISVWSKNKSYDYGSNFINWTLQKRYSDGNETVLKRFYYLFKLSEIEELIKESDINNRVSIDKCYESYNNIYTILSIYR